MTSDPSIRTNQRQRGIISIQNDQGLQKAASLNLRQVRKKKKGTPLWGGGGGPGTPNQMLFFGKKRATGKKVVARWTQALEGDIG